MSNNPRILIVDDDPHMRRLLRLMLETARYEVDEAVNGLRLLSKLRLRLPDLIILDVMMSWASGMDLCRSLKSNPHFCSVPICLISGHRTSLSDQEVARQHGAVAYFTKPIHWPTLLSTLDGLLGRRGSLTMGLHP
jgi:DNA-binding response OmpR family regulator